jgi:hypothetical protein
MLASFVGTTIRQGTGRAHLDARAATFARLTDGWHHHNSRAVAHRNQLNAAIGASDHTHAAPLTTR